jgi:hypothetical protein
MINQQSREQVLNHLREESDLYNAPPPLFFSLQSSCRKMAAVFAL